MIKLKATKIRKGKYYIFKGNTYFTLIHGDYSWLLYDNIGLLLYVSSTKKDCLEYLYNC